MKGNPSTFFSWETLPTNCPREDCVVTLLYPVFPFTFPLDCSISVHGREILSSYQGLAHHLCLLGFFQGITLSGVVWAVNLLLEMPGAHSWPCCWRLMPSDVPGGHLWVDSACWGCGGIQVTKHPKGTCEPGGSCFRSCVCESGLFSWLVLQSVWAIWKSQRAK